MSEENAELIRRSVEAYNRRDLDGLLETWAPDVVLDWSNSRGPDAGVFRGQDEVRAFAEQLLESWDQIRMELVEEPIEADDDLLIMDNVAHMRGRGGIEVEARSAWLITIRDGLQSSITMYQTKQEALEAARQAR